MDISKIQMNIWSLLILVVMIVNVFGDWTFDTSDKTMKLRLEKVRCVGGKYLNFTTCRTKFLSRNVVTATIIGTLTKKLTAYRVNVKTYYQFSNNEYRPSRIDHGFDYCAIQAGVSKSPLWDVLENLLANHTNVLQKCPYLPGEYYVKDLNPQLRHTPSWFPAGRYLVKFISYMQNDESFFNVDVYYSITNYGLQQ